MQEFALTVNGLRKQYKTFTLDDVSFQVPRGAVVGLVGENGAGKSTVIRAVLGLVSKDAGSISLLGKSEAELDFETRNKIGIVFDGNNFPENRTPELLGRMLKGAYPLWDDGAYHAWLQKLAIPAKQKVKTFSKGMKMKLAIAVALSHQSELLVLDEATSGLDPVIRDDILDLFLDFVQDETHSVLVSSHITSDLEKVADYIVFLHQGKVVFQKPKDELRYQYGILRCTAAQFEQLDRRDIAAYRKQDYVWEALVEDRAAARKKYPGVTIDGATIDEIMLIYIKGEQI